MEIAYEYLMKNGVYNRRTLQNLAHVLSFNKNEETLNKCLEIKKELEKNKTFADIAATISDNFNVKAPANGTSVLDKLV